MANRKGSFVMHMRKLIALLMSFLLLLSTALGETETRIVEFDDFTLAVSADDLLLLGEEAGSSNIFKVFPHDHAAAASHPNIIARWTAQDLSDLSNEDVLDFCNGDMQAAIQSMTAQNLAVSNKQLLRAERDSVTGSITVLFTLDVDVSALGLDIEKTVCMGCRYIPLGEKGSYSFTIGCETVEEAEALFDYLDRNLTIKQ